MQARQLLLDSFRSAVAAADPFQIVSMHLPAPPRGRTLVVGAGKAAAAMAVAVEQYWPANAPLGGMVITRYRHGLPTKRIKVIEAGHPIPDQAGEAAAKEILRTAGSLEADDLLLVLVSGGGSALLSLPLEGISIGDLSAVTNELLLCGAPIREINTVRKHLSAIQGGRLAAACKAPVLALIISDVTGDDPTHVASGPCAPDPTTYADAVSILDRYRLNAPKAVRDHLERGADGGISETPKPGDSVFARTENRVIATAQTSLQAAAQHFRTNGIRAAVLGDSITGEAVDVAKVHGAIARQVTAHGEPWNSPVAIISGGECTVTVGSPGAGRGGRCTEFLLSMAIDLAGMPNVHAIACDTDGIDGSEDNAGAVLTPDTLGRAAAAGLDAVKSLEKHDSYGFFSALSDLVVCGPTRTNVNDYRAILVV